MKTVLSLLLSAVVLFVGGGCAFMSDEDRDFYGKGWVKPTDLDTPMKHHTVNDPSRPQPAADSVYNNAPRASATPTPADPEWLVPETAPR